MNAPVGLRVKFLGFGHCRDARQKCSEVGLAYDQGKPSAPF